MLGFQNTYLRVFLLKFLLVIVIQEKIVNSIVPPCSDILLYNDNDRSASFLYNGSSHENLVYLEAHLIQPTAAISNYTFKFSVVGLAEDAMEKFLRNEPVLYRIDFDSWYDPLPKVGKIIVNSNGICRVYCKETLINDKFQISTNYRAVVIYPNGVLKGFLIGLQDCSHWNEYLSDIDTVHPYLVSNNKDDYGQSFDPNSQMCGQTAPQFKMIEDSSKRQPIAIGTWPWLIALFRITPASKEFQCGGNLVSNRAVITSAHCLFESEISLSPNQIIMYMGMNNIQNDFEQYSVRYESKKFYQHPDYRANLYNFDADIAIIITATEVIFTPYIRPVCIWSGLKNEEVIGLVARIGGWGKDENGQLSNVPILNTARIVSDEMCLESNDYFQSITTRRNFCAGNLDGKGPCSGDSGGGLLIFRNNRWELRGTVSVLLADNSGHYCNHTQYTIYTDALKFKTWLYLGIKFGVD